MGCTSSAPNMTPSLNSEKDQSILDELEETMEQGKQITHKKEKDLNGIKVLPTCDNLDEPTQLDSHSKYLTDTSPALEKDSQSNGHVMESENGKNSASKTERMNLEENTQTEDKLSSLEEVVDKVVELHENGDLELNLTETIQTKEENTQKNTEAELEDTTKKMNDKSESSKDAENEEAEEAASPSQSQSSRATRWEALADIAAELPPSLAVDPVTGQIYALK